MISAQVILKPSHGKDVAIAPLVTSENIHIYLPDEAVADRIKKYFTDHGFACGPIVGISFSITGTKDLFNEFFNVRIIESASEGVFTSEENEKELPLDPIESDLEKWILSIVFPTPPEYFDDTEFSFF